MILINSSSRNALKIFQPFLPIFVPIGCGSIIGYGKQNGIDIKFIDEQIEDNVLKLVRGYVKEIEQPYIFGFSVLTIAFGNAITLSQKLRKLYPDAVIIFGGIHPTALPEEVLSYSHIDAVVRGEGEQTLVDLYTAIKEGRSFKHLNNISYRRNGKIIHNPYNLVTDNLDIYPPFPYQLFSGKHYDLGFILRLFREFCG